MRKRIVCTCLCVCLVVTLAGCAHGGRPKTRQEIAALALSIHTKFPDPDDARDKQGSDFHQSFLGLGLERLGANDLSELRNDYAESCVEPKIQDAVTEEMDLMIRETVGRAVRLTRNRESFEPAEVYVISSFDPGTYEGHLENTFADDSFHLPEFPESYGNRIVRSSATDVFRIQLDTKFSTVVGPHYYRGHTWQVGDVDDRGNGSFGFHGSLIHSVLFSLVAEKVNPKRLFKVLWVVDGTGQE